MKVAALFLSRDRERVRGVGRTARSAPGRLARLFRITFESGLSPKRSHVTAAWTLSIPANLHSWNSRKTGLSWIIEICVSSRL